MKIKRKQKFIIWGVVFCSLLSLVALPISAKTDGYYTYEVLNGEATITGIDLYDISVKDIIIPSTLGDCSVTGIKLDAFDGFNSVTIPETVTNIKTSLYGIYPSIIVSEDNPNYSSLDGVLFNKDKSELISYPKSKRGEYRIPDGVTNIGARAFYGCSCTSIKIPKSVNSIGKYSFAYCHPTDVYCAGSESECPIKSNSFYNGGTYYHPVMHYNYVAATGVALNKTAVSIDEGKKGTLKATVEPENAYDNSVLWSSSDTDVVTVTDGVLRAISEGTATVTATASDGGFTADCEVTVNKQSLNENSPIIKISSTKGKAGGLVEVTVSIENNSGIIAMLLDIDYDSDALTLTDVEDTGILGSATHTDNLSVKPYNLYWNNSTSEQNITTSGVAATLTFAISENAEEKDYPITVSYDYDNIVDVDMNSVDFAVINGKISVISDIIYGDANGDGIVNSKDNVFLARYLSNWSGYDEKTIDINAADADASGKITAKDNVILARHLAKWTGYETLPYKK